MKWLAYYLVAWVTVWLVSLLLGAPTWAAWGFGAVAGLVFANDMRVRFDD